VTGSDSDVDLHHHGDRDVAPGMLDLAVNVRLPGPPAWLRDRLIAAIDGLGTYPDPASTRNALARRHNRRPEEVRATAGAAEAFVLLARTLRPSRAVCVHPSFTAPEAALLAAGIPVERVVLAEPYALTPDRIPVDADLVIVGNPTNPTGVLHSAATLAGLARPGRVLVVDEAFIDTVPGERGSLASRVDLPGLVVVRSLTKTWGLAGLRVGYLLGDAGLVQRLAAAQPLWSVSSLGLVALQACSEPPALAAAERAARVLVDWRRDLIAELTALPGVRVVAPSQTSFVLLTVPEGDAVRTRLRVAGVAVRRGDTFPGLGPDYLRVAVREPKINTRTVQELAAALDARAGTG
jgi:histidinol-phosphate aminotransferase